MACARMTPKTTISAQIHAVMKNIKWLKKAERLEKRSNPARLKMKKLALNAPIRIGVIRTGNCIVSQPMISGVRAGPI